MSIVKHAFKIGDKLRVINNMGAPLDYKIGDVGVFTGYSTRSKRFPAHDCLVLDNHRVGMHATRFELVTEYPNAPHKHADVIKAWADGADIEYCTGSFWHPASSPVWRSSTKYRVKPAKSDKDIKIEALEKQALELAAKIAKIKDYT